MRRAWTAAVLMVALWAWGCFAEPTSAPRVNPAMTRGPATALVTIVEFSDYQ